ncbi:gamma-glutamylcyclotransferase family protein [Chryseolinea soli]|uniref:Gamma-glutamylcyclotransferase n=1 Tax=Chryseolinea soli TaxID=2321403 RepID=A0A385SVY8_9BACT|nr:gamma-glutamylcyclotransferase family protein [Chryseolinea soli]AYB34706.1 gamma-glutamylcyclotransferase [Chryseolinea soli]
MTENLFSYGTLQLESVQLSTFHRLLQGRKDAIIGYSLSYIEIVDEEVLAKSGLTHHPILYHSGKAEDEVEGMVFSVTKEELLQADEYEVDDYKRVAVPLKSGGLTWVYVAV